jgi:hypothetical protein
MLLAELISTWDLVDAGRGLILVGVCSGDLNALLIGSWTWPLGSSYTMIQILQSTVAREVIVDGADSLLILCIFRELR